MSSGRISAGLRVVRGDDWTWKDQDGGDGYVGTVVEIGGQGSSLNPDNTVVVVWDNGVRGSYRAGYEGNDDLRVIDNAPTGFVFNSPHLMFFLSDLSTIAFCSVSNEPTKPTL